MYQEGYTPLISAVEYGQFPMVEYLLEKGADMEAKDDVSRTLYFCRMDHSHAAHPYIEQNMTARKDSISSCCISFELSDCRVSGGEGC